MNKSHRFLCWLVLGFWGLAPGQTAIDGAATIQIIDVGSSCAGRGRILEIRVDLSGLSGLGGDAALGAFVLDLVKSRTDLFARVDQGSLGSGWSFDNTVSVEGNEHIRWVAYSSNLNQPVGNILVGHLTLTGSAGTLTLSLSHAESSIASTIVNGDGPGSIDIDASPVLLSISIPLDFELSLDEGASLWLQTSTLYDFDGEGDQVNIPDLVALINCGG